MSENKKFILVLCIILVIFTGEKLWKKIKRTKPSSEKSEKSYIVKMERYTYKEVGRSLDINSSSIDEMLENKISMSHGEKIIEYRDITGGFEDLEELRRISGIGEKTYEKLKDKFVVGEVLSKKMLGINSASQMELLYFGFTKKEIKKIEEARKTTKIFDNIAFLEIVGEQRYYELRDYIRYD